MTTMAVIMVKERVAAGAAWLDEVRPDWPIVIGREGVAVLAIESHEDCPLGLVWGDYFAAPAPTVCGVEACPCGPASDWAIEHGFLSWMGGDWFELSQEWREVITARLDELEAAGVDIGPLPSVPE